MKIRVSTAIDKIIIIFGRSKPLSHLSVYVKPGFKTTSNDDQQI